MKKRMLSLCLAVVMVQGLLPVTSLAEETPLNVEPEIEPKGIPITKLSFVNDNDAVYTELTIQEEESVDAIACCTPRGTTELDLTFTSEDTSILVISDTEVTADQYGHAKVTLTGVRKGQTRMTVSSRIRPEVKADLAVTVVCGHKNTTKTPVYAQVSGTETHTVTTKCECGETVSTGNGSCVDADTDGECDLCGGTVQIPEVTGPTCIFDSSVHGDWGSSTYLKKLHIDGVAVKSYEWKDGACIVTLAAGTAQNAAITFSAEGLGGNGGKVSLYVGGSKTNRVVNLVDGTATVEVKTTSSFSSTSMVSARTVSFLIDGAETVPVERIVITPAYPRVVENSSTQLYATVYPEDATIKDVVWRTSASDTAITLTETGKVMGSTMGLNQYYTITATSKSNPEVSASCQIYLHARNNVLVTGISLDKNTAQLEKGKTMTLNATLAPANSTLKTVTWSSSNERVATVEDGVVTAVGVGSTTITATAADGGFTATCEITVAEPACSHTDTAPAYERIAGTETHTVTVNCICGEMVGQTTENCVDETGDNRCDKCLAAVTVPVLLGDVDGSGGITSDDAALILRYVAMLTTEINEMAADADGNGCITSDDAALVLRYVAQLIDKFPAAP